MVYENVLMDKKRIIKDLRHKCGVYKWVNKTNGKTYIGSSVDLSLRLSNYLSPSYLKKRSSDYNSRIYNALLHYGYDSFRIEILEICDKNDVINREQNYIDVYEPEYNILGKAGSSLGFKHSKGTLLKFKSRKLSEQALFNLKRSKYGVTPSALAKTNQLLSRSHPIIIKDIRDDTINKFPSIRDASRQIGVSHATLLNYIDTDRLYKGKYLIVRYKNV